MKIYDQKSKTWDFLIIIFTYISSALVIQCYENSHDAWKSFIDKYEVTDERQEMFNELTKRWNNCNIKDNCFYSYIWFNELYNLNLKSKKIKA